MPSSGTKSASHMKWGVILAAFLLFAAGGYLVFDGWCAPEFSSRTLKLAFAIAEISAGIYLAVVAIGVAARFEWARLSAIWIAALSSPVYVLRLLLVSTAINPKVRDFAMTENLPQFFLLSFVVIFLSSLVVLILTSHAGRAVFPHVTDRERTDWIGLTTLTLCIALDLVVMVNYVVSRHYERFDVTRVAFYDLSDKTKSVLRSLKEPVDVIVYFSRENDLYEHLTNLLSEYQRFSPNLRVEYIDPFRAPVQSERVRKQYGVGQENVVIFSTGAGDALRKKYVNAHEMADYDYGEFALFQRRPPRMRAFKAEQVFTSAILNVVGQKQPKVYFLTGHGERDPSDFERTGYATVSTYLKRDNMLVEKLNLAARTDVPADCDLLVIAGPAKAIPPSEVQILRNYLNNGGRMLVLLDALVDSGLEQLLSEWNVRVNSDVILGKVSIFGAKGVAAVAYVEEYGSHPVVSKMQGVSTSFPYCRSLSEVIAGESKTPAPGKVRVTALAKAPEGFWGETNFAEEMQRRQLKFDEGVDLPGPLSVAVAVEAPGAGGRDDTRGARMVVIGSSSFVSNEEVDGNNMDFLLNATNWLLHRQELIGIAPKTPQEFALRMTPKQLFWTRVCVVLGLPGSVAVIGIVTWFVRRK